MNAAIFLNVNNYLEDMEDVKLGFNLRRLVLRDAMKYSDKSKFLSTGTVNLEHLEVNKTILS